MAMPKSFYDIPYFSGSQIFLTINGIEMDEITAVNVQVEQYKTPLYGYASTLFDAIIPGTTLVRGQFSVNFLHPNLMTKIITHNNKDLQREKEKKSKNNSFYIIDGISISTIGNWDITTLKKMFWRKQAKENKTSESERPDEISRFFDIVINYGRDDSNNVSQRTVKDASIVGGAQNIMVGGEVTQELYNFIARDIVTTKRS